MLPLRPGSTGVDYLTHKPKISGSNLVTGAWREKIAKKMFSNIIY